MKIGVGVLTTPARTVNPYVFHFSKDSNQFEIHSDVTREGPAVGRNRLLKLLQDNDYIFLFDDDCYPVMFGWEEYFICKSIQHNVHYMALIESFKTPLNQVEGEMGFWEGGLGAFTFQTKRALLNVGGYNTAYDKYGYEDAGRLNRVCRSGINPSELNPFPLRGMAYIHSEDVFAQNPPENFDYPTKLALIEKNRPLYEQETTGKIFYGYE